MAYITRFAMGKLKIGTTWRDSGQIRYSNIYELSQKTITFC